VSKKNSTAPMPTAMTRSATLVTFAHAGHTYSAAHWPAAGPGVVALHGFTGSGLDFESLAKALPTFDWWALDLPGHGNTAPLDSGGSWMLETCAATAALIASLAAENPQRPIHLLGYSLGGRVALQTLARTSATEHREKLVVVGATPGIGDARERARRQDWDRALAEHIRREGMVAFLESWQQQPLIATQTRIEAGPLARMQARRRARARWILVGTSSKRSAKRSSSWSAPSTKSIERSARPWWRGCPTGAWPWSKRQATAATSKGWCKRLHC